ncbi:MULTISPECIES: LUD domain-containing protein [unclassified Actinobaculum]|uniref:LutC/YkgG family protein n=1 Tax=unclassified Actinobaculum TaxID=2609299 RepID=UPI000D5278C7|nr:MULTISPECIES: LUD domain-containing protein [unclassified Actinobaculum]AWE42975.1 lactate utilization protein B/C [Actinobaculum sp. 313]RTE48935.1 lactate utilization protein C [Actinobaculum sp. 352]
MKAMNEAKVEILRRVAAAGPVEAPEIPREYRTSGSGDIVAEMEQALIDYTATVTHCTPDGIPEAIAAALKGASSVVVPPGLEKSWQEAAAKGCEVRVDDPPLTKDELDGTDAVLTASRVAVSLSGTIMLDGEPDQGRRAISLVPDMHVCVLYASTIKATVPEAVEVLSQHPTRPTTWIAGPSATSDIELVRVDGVHGPRTLRVIIVDDVG